MCWLFSSLLQPQHCMRLLSFAVPCRRFLFAFIFFFNAPATTEIYTLSLHDALPISVAGSSTRRPSRSSTNTGSSRSPTRSEEHTSELQSRVDLVCRLLLEKKKK